MIPEWLSVLLVAYGAFALATLVYALWVLRDVTAMSRDSEQMTRETIALMQRGDDEGLRSLLHDLT